MLRPFSFEKTDMSDQGNRNWRIFDENSKTITYGSGELSIALPTGTPTITQAFFTLYGPLVFFMMEIDLDIGDGWVLGTSTIAMPFGAVYTGASKFAAVVPQFQIYTDLGVAITTAYMRIGNTLGFSGTYTSGVAQNVYIQGWYYRN